MSITRSQTSIAAGRAGDTLRFTSEARRRRIVIAATFTAEPVQDSLGFWINRLALPWQVCFAPYNQLFQQCVDPGSLIRTNHDGLNVALIRPEDWLGISSIAIGGPTERSARLRRTADEWTTLLRNSLESSPVNWLVCICPISRAVRVEPWAKSAIRNVELGLVQAFKANRNVTLFPSEEFLRLYPADYDDPSANRLGHVPYAPGGYAALGTLIARKAFALSRRPKKVIALDCDQTLWGGICGEAGPERLHLHAAHRALQEFMLRQQQAGMLLCLCSKNNEADVAAVFQKRTDMILRPDDFVAKRVNWRPKSENLRSLADELSLGLDSFILVDDSAVECAEVAARCPGVAAVRLPEELSSWPQFLEHLWLFDRSGPTLEDARRTEMYRQNRERENLRARVSSLEEFVAGLELEVEITPPPAEQLVRVAQLTQRTNQFNCTGKIRSLEELLRLQRENLAHVLVVQAKDRFGEYGLTGVVVYESKAADLLVDTFLLSCRTLGRGIEHRMLARLGEIALEQGLATVNIPFHLTDRNVPAWEFLNRLAFRFRQAADGGFLFRIPASVAASARLGAEDATWPENPRESSTTEPSGRILPTRSEPDLPYDWIARHASDPERILELIERSEGPRGSRLADACVPPGTRTEAQLCALWQEVLRLEIVGVEDNFFELGGTSQLAVRMLAKVEKSLGRTLSLFDLFSKPTIRLLALLLDRESNETSPTETATAASELTGTVR